MRNIPIVNRFFSKTKSEDQAIAREKTKELHSDSHITQPINKHDQKDIVVIKTGKKDKGLKSIRTYLDQHQDTKVIFKRFPNFATELEQQIKKIGPSTPVEFKGSLLINTAVRFFNNLSDSFKKRLNALNNVEFNERSHLNYIELWNDFTTETKRLILEISDTILNKTIAQDNASDIDVANALSICKELSKNIANHALSTLTEGMLELPIDIELASKDGKSNATLRELIGSEFEHELLTLYLASKFGIHSKQAIDSFMTSIESVEDKRGTDLYENLVIINKLQEAIHGSILQDRRDPSSRANDVALLNSSIIKETLSVLIKMILTSMELRKDRKARTDKDREEIKSLESSEKDIKDCLFKCGVTETLVHSEAMRAEQDPLWKNLGVDSGTIGSNIRKSYNQIYWLSSYLGEMQEEEILGYEVKRTNVLNLLNISDSEPDVHFKRLIMEISLLAAIDAISTYRGRKKEDDDFTSVKKNLKGAILPATMNFTSIPWLKALYKARYNHFKDLIQQDSSEFKAASIAQELSKLGNELHKTKYFTSKNFFARYDTEKFSKHMLHAMGDFTDIGKMALNIDLFSNLFSYLTTKEHGNMSSDEIQNIKSLIKYLRKECEIIDETDQAIYDPPANNQPAIKTYNKMRGIFADRGFLSLNTPLLISFLRNTFGRNEPIDKPLDQESFASKNRILATWLFYMLVKFLPEHSNDPDSLNARVQIFRQLMDENFQKKTHILRPLFKKMARQARGISEDGDYPNEQGRKGVVKALCFELEAKIKQYATGKGRECPIALKDLLEQYHVIEKCLRKNPRAHEKILEVQKSIFKNNDPLLKPLTDTLIDVLDVNPTLVVQFAKQKSNENPQLKDKLANDILGRIGRLCLQMKNNNNNVIVIRDSDEANIQQLTKILEYSIYLGYLMNTLNQNYTNLQVSNFANSGKSSATIKSELVVLNRILNAQILLQRDERYREDVEAFPNQFETKNKLTHLLSKPYLKITPLFGTNFVWLDKHQEQKLRMQSAYGDRVAA